MLPMTSLCEQGEFFYSAVAVAEATAAIDGTLGVAGTISAIEGTVATVSQLFHFVRRERH